MSAHTPGPWEVALEIFDNGGIPETVIQAFDGRAAVAVALEFGANNPGMRDANARLIAAAPDLLEALIDVLRVNETDVDACEWAAAMLNSRAAIAKATESSN